MEIARVLRVIGNLFINAGWLWVFSSLGWISFTVEIPLWQVFIMTALFAWLVEVIFDWLYLTFIFTTCFIGCLTLPIMMFIQGWIILWATSNLTHWFTINCSFFWIGLLMSIALGWVHIPRVNSKQ
ncbi:MAG: hypothetical protein PHS06_02870 [Candidatus Shapirobacteria bacterium]|nr:hypothetical protein [Candidatus Shapirobacteria bacterium]